MFRNLMLAIGLFCPVLAFADAQGEERPSFSASRTITVGATVTAIDQETREVTLEGPEGETMNFIAGPEVRNLAQVSVGDRVIAEMIEEIALEVLANPEGVAPGAGEFVAGARAEAGELPAAGVMDSVVITAVVEAIDLGASTFKLRFAEGDVREFAAADPENLQRSEVGDLVVITITEAMGIRVEHPDSE